MDIPVVYYDDLANSLLPSAQRLPLWEAFTQASLSQDKRLYELFVAYMDGSTAPYWDSTATYTKGAHAKDISGVYESLADGNLDNALSDTASWYKVLDSFIGVNERVKYNGRYLTLTWALNRYFGTEFRQPPYPAPYDFGLGGGTFPDIYITTDALTQFSFMTYDSIDPSNTTTDNPSGFYTYDSLITGIASTYQYTIHMPLGVYNALGPTDAIRESVVRNFVDLYNLIGLGYSITTY